MGKMEQINDIIEAIKSNAIPEYLQTELASVPTPLFGLGWHPEMKSRAWALKVLKTYLDRSWYICLKGEARKQEVLAMLTDGYMAKLQAKWDKRQMQKANQTRTR